MRTFYRRSLACFVSVLLIAAALVGQAPRPLAAASDPEPTPVTSAPKSPPSNQEALASFQAGYKGLHVGGMVSMYPLDHYWDDDKKEDVLSIETVFCYHGPVPKYPGILHILLGWGPPYMVPTVAGEGPDGPTFTEVPVDKPPIIVDLYWPQKEDQRIPPGCWAVDPPFVYSGTLEDYTSRPILDAVVAVPAEAKATLTADASAWVKDKPVTVYLKADPVAQGIECPVDVTVHVPGWFEINDAQDAVIKENDESPVTAYDSNQKKVDSVLWADPMPTESNVPYHTLTWTTRLDPGKPFERWITVTPGDPPEGLNVQRAGIYVGPIFTGLDPGKQYQNAQVSLPVVTATASLAAETSHPMTGVTGVDFTIDDGGANLQTRKIAVWTEGAAGGVQPLIVGSFNGQPTNEIWVFEGDTYHLQVAASDAPIPAGNALPPGTTKLLASIVGSTPIGDVRAAEKLEIPLTGDDASVSSDMTLHSADEPKASTLPAIRKPTDNVEPGYCLGGSPDQQKHNVIITVKPPFLSKKRDYKATVTAEVIGDTFGKLPLTLTVSKPGKLTDIRVNDRFVTATLTTTDTRATSLDLTATTADDNDSAWTSVEVGGDAFLEGRVALRTGNLNDEVPVVRGDVKAVAEGQKSPYVAERYTDSSGKYVMRVEADKPLTVSVTAPDYLPATLHISDPAVDDDGAIPAPPIYLVQQGTLQDVQRKLELVAKRHDDLRNGSSALVQAGLLDGGLSLAQVPDPTSPDGLISTYLNRMQTVNEGRPIYAEEALTRLDLALEAEVYASAETKRYADSFVDGMWDGGLGLLSELWSTVDESLKLTEAMKLVASAAQRRNLQELNSRLTQQRNVVEQAMFNVIAAAYNASGRTNTANDGNLADASKMPAKTFKYLVEKLREESAKRWDKAAPEINKALGGVGLDAGSGASTTVSNLIKGGPMEALKGELKAILAIYLSTGYLDMVNTELTAAGDRARTGDFSAGGVEVARGAVHDDIQDLQAIANISSLPPDLEALQTFVEGSIKDFQGWGETAITAVTAGGAVPVLANIDKVLTVVKALIAGGKLKRATDLYWRTLAVDSPWFEAVKKSIRDAFNAKAEPLSATGRRYGYLAG